MTRTPAGATIVTKKLTEIVQKDHGWNMVIIDTPRESKSIMWYMRKLVTDHQSIGLVSRIFKKISDINIF